MKQLIGLVRLSALTALSAALYDAHHQTQATETTDNHHPQTPDRRVDPEGELVLLDFDGTVFAREVNLAPHAT
jgi:hypothetical protein